MPEVDLLIQGGTVLDGTGNPAFKADISVCEGKIVAVGEFTAVNSARTINANGKIVTPGFIDAHCHTDIAWSLEHPGVQGKLSQGVTTDVCGLCSESAAPITSNYVTEFQRRNTTNPQSVPPIISVVEYFDHINANGNSTNIAMFIGNNNLRIAAMGYEPNYPSNTQMTAMRDLLHEGFNSGAMGLSSGLTYVPSGFATVNELIELCRSISPNGIYNSHMRNESDFVEESVAEVIEIARQANVRGHVSHLKATGRANHGKSVKLLEQVNSAIAQGIRISFDVYPYTAGSIGLINVFPPWFRREYPEILDRTKTDEYQQRMSADMQANDWENVSLSCGWDHIRIGFAGGLTQFEGKALQKIAHELNLSELEAALHVLRVAGNSTTIVYDAVAESDLQNLLLHPLCMIGTDAFARDYTGPTAIGRPHPRNYGAFPRFIRRYSLDQSLLSLPEAIHRITGLTAQIFNLTCKGQLKPGFDADITIFDPDAIAEAGDYNTPALPPHGIDQVVIHGRLALDQGEFFDLRAGRIVRRNDQAL